MQYRVGIGYDIHRLVQGRPLFIGGAQIPYVKGLLGHSDGDVLLHAVCDALLGAIGGGDIGQLFPDTDPKYQGIDSKELLKAVADLVREKKYTVNNVDTIIVAEEPKMLPFEKEMRRKISAILEIPEDRVNIKAKTSEGMGEIGKIEAIASYAIVSIVPRED
ncbi:MAG: 2-C-methyl-D-erythritol 2,4-cyclodiphosphate synthase [Omnitrophica WOR_2 bacterium RBG_13_41_10]|nr:MAG: 2-C-methyl-D-erythritol 2,4-cyclodiphosphate synthase [Omnitrophica WOR_2 bacterium RBG_13_41_10]